VRGVQPVKTDERFSRVVGGLILDGGTALRQRSTLTGAEASDVDEDRGGLAARHFRSPASLRPECLPVSETRLAELSSGSARQCVVKALRNIPMLFVGPESASPHRRRRGCPDYGRTD
jgi:hypothetical protein